MMHLLIGKLVLLGYEGTALTGRHPAADTFELVAAELAGATAVTRHGAEYTFTVERERSPAAAGAVGPPRHLRRRGPAAGPGRRPVVGAGCDRGRRVRCPAGARGRRRHATPVLVTPIQR